MTSRGLIRSVARDDYERAWGVVGALLAYRAEQQASETAQAAGADDQEVCSFGFGAEDIGWLALRNNFCHFNS